MLTVDSPLTPSLANLLLPEYRSNPYAVYRRLRDQDPVYWDAQWGAWVVTGHSEVMTALRDHRFSAEREIMSVDWAPVEQQAMVEPILRAILRQMLFLDPPDHTRLRTLASKAFTPRVVEGMRHHIQTLVDDLLDQVAKGDTVDIIERLAYPLPAIVIAELLGAPEDERDQFKHWSDDFAAFLDGTALTKEQAVAALGSVGEMMAYFHYLIERRRGSSHNDLLQAMITAEEQGDMLSEEELLTKCVLLLAAGHETTTNLIGNGLLALLRHPDQLRMLQDNPALIGSAVHELLRYDSPVQQTGRRAKEDLHLGGKHIAAGQFVTTVLGAANRDPAQFPDPDKLDISRDASRHLAFGYGIHFCLGAPLARLEGAIALNTIVQRFPALQLASDTAQWKESVVFRSLETLPVLLG